LPQAFLSHDCIQIDNFYETRTCHHCFVAALNQIQTSAGTP
jgi:hypothetical protein